MSLKQNQLLTAWQLADLSFYAILNSNDYRSEQPNNESVYLLCNQILHSEDEKVKLFKNSSQLDKKTLLMFGMGQKQFWYQEIIKPRNVYYNFLRYYILLSEIPRHFPSHKHPDIDLVELTGFNISDFSRLLMAGWTCIYLGISPIINYKIDSELQESMPILTEDNLKQCLSYFAGDYKYYRNSFPNNPLFFRPIIKNDRGRHIISNAFIWARKFYEGVFWLLRDKYMKDNSQTFINNFGNYYEKYIEEILEFYLERNQYEKINQTDNKSADWKIITSNYIIIIEQKSSLMTVSLKKEYPSLDNLDKYLDKFKEAYIQLAGTAASIDSSEKEIVKLVLHFEKLYIAESVIKERVNKLCESELNDFSNYFFIDTEEFEKLIQLLYSDEAAFNNCLKTIIELQDNPAPAYRGKEFKFIIDENSNSDDINYLDNYGHLFEMLFERVS